MIDPPVLYDYIRVLNKLPGVRTTRGSASEAVDQLSGQIQSKIRNRNLEILGWLSCESKMTVSQTAGVVTPSLCDSIPTVSTPRTAVVNAWSSPESLGKK